MEGRVREYSRALLELLDQSYGSVVRDGRRDYPCGGDQAGVRSFRSGFCDTSSCPLPSAFMT